MAASRFVNVSDEDISQFLEEIENKNTARKTSQEVALFKTFLEERKLNDREELTPLQLDLTFSSFLYVFAYTIIKCVLYFNYWLDFF